MERDQKMDKYNILVIGNDPIELSNIYDRLKKLSPSRFKTYFSFDIRNIAAKLRRLNPDTLLIDDRMGADSIRKLVDVLRRKKFSNLTLTLLKSSNFHGPEEEGIDDYMMKDNFTADGFYKSLKNTFRIRRTSALFRSYLKGRRSVKKLMT